VAFRGVPTFNGYVTGSNVAVELWAAGSSRKRITGPVSDTDLASHRLTAEWSATCGAAAGRAPSPCSARWVCGRSALLRILGQQVKHPGFTSVNAVYSAFTGSPNALNGTFDINQGVLNTQDLSLTNNRARLLATGDANIAAWTMDMIANIFSQEYPDQPYLSIDLDGPMDGPNTKFSGNALRRHGCRPSASIADRSSTASSRHPGSGGSESGGGMAFRHRRRHPISAAMPAWG
jgi:hypothetical protein